MRKHIIISVIFLFFASFKSESSVLEIITVGPGDAFWSAFGHTAIKIGEPQDEALMFGFGYFDFAEENFLNNFIFGHMYYYLGINYAQTELMGYERANRSLYSQGIVVTDAEAYAVGRQLKAMVASENRSYRYDYFINNCTSKVRDILNDLSDGKLYADTQGLSGRSWYDAAFPAPGQGWMNLGIAVGFGVPAYRERTHWELMSLPRELMEQLNHLDNSVLEVSMAETLSGISVVQQKRYNQFGTHYPLVLVVLTLVLFLLLPPTRLMAAKVWLFIQSLIGLFLLFLWFFTEHSVASLNFNVLLFLPVAFLFIKQLKPELLLVPAALWLLCAIFYSAYYLLPFLAVTGLTIRALRRG